MNEAVETATKYVENFAYKLNNGTEISGFKIKSSEVELLTRQKEPLTLYPYWAVELHLDHLYPGNVYAIFVGVWADNGEVFICQPLGYSGSLPPEDLTIEDASQSTPKNIESYMLAIIPVAIILR